MIYFYLAQGFEETEMIYPLDLCLRAGIDAKTVSVTNEKAVTGSHGITVKADLTVYDAEYTPEKADAFILPGGMPGTLGLEKSEAVQKAIRFGYENSRYLCAICAAPLVLGKAGLLQGKKAVCYPGFETYLLGATNPPDKCVTDGKIITAVGAGAAAEFGLAIISELCGKETAEKIKNAILL